MRVLIGMILLVLAVSATAAPQAKRVLLFSHTTGYRHASVEAGVAAIRALGVREKIEVVASEDPGMFAADTLKRYDAIILLSTTTDPKKPETEWLQGSRRSALQGFVRGGGGVLAIHAAADSHYHWPWYGKLIGGRFQRHPQGTPNGVLQVVDRRHASTTRLPATIRRSDEWYYFDDYDPRSQLLVALDPASIGERDVNPNPVSWARTFEGGRVFYTAMGHTAESYSEPEFLAHIAGALRWVTRQK